MALRFVGVTHAPLGFDALAPSAVALVVAVVLDLMLGDPVYAGHPIRLVGATLSFFERALRSVGADGYVGGIVLFVALAVVWVGGLGVLVVLFARLDPWAGWAVHVFLLYSLIALGDLLHHVRRIEAGVAADDLPRARAAVSALVGRDTDRMDGAACRRAAVESLSENLVDGFTSPLAWYLVGGLPGLVLFKVVSTMDSMVGFKTSRYLQFGWCGARLDDVMNWVPARLTWALIGLVAGVVPGCSAVKAWRIGLAQHATLPGPNSGWSEAATAGATERRLVGPIWNGGRLVTDVWIGDPADPPLATAGDLQRAVRLVTISGLAAAILVGLGLFSWVPMVLGGR
jgi:adenosylcobinamide-phosphate synthase